MLNIKRACASRIVAHDTLVGAAIVSGSSLHTNYGLCYHEPIIIISSALYYSGGIPIFFDSKHKNILVTPQSAVAGSRLGTIDVLIDEAIVDTIQSLYIVLYQYSVYVTHNNSGEEVQHYHNLNPSFSLIANNTIPEQILYFDSMIFNSPSLTKLRDVPTANCTNNSTKFLILTFDIILRSDSLYHLGEHSESLYGSLRLDGSTYLDIDTILNLQVQAGYYSRVAVRM